MTAKAFGSSVATLPLYLASKSFARCISRASVCSIFGSSGDAKRSLRFQRTVSAPVCFRAWAIEFSGYPLSEVPHPTWVGPASGVRAFIDGLRQLGEQPLRPFGPPPHEWGGAFSQRLLVFERRFGRGATASQPSLQAVLQTQHPGIRRLRARASAPHA